MCGAGKTTLLRRLVVAVQELGGLSLPSIEMPVQPYGGTVWLETAKVVANALSSSPFSVTNFLCNGDNWWLPHKLGFRIAGTKMRRATSAPLLVDSGVLQPFISFAIEWNVRGSYVPAEAFLGTLALPELAIYVKVPPEVAYERYVRRAAILNRELPPGDVRPRFHKGYETCERLCELYQQRNLTLEVLNAENMMQEGELMSFAQTIIDRTSHMQQ